MVIYTKLSHGEPFCGCSTVDLQKSPNFLNHESNIKCCNVAKDCPFSVSDVAASFPTESDQLPGHFNQRLYYIYIQSANNNKIKVDSIETRVFSSLEFHWPGNQLVRTSEVNRVLIHCVAERVKTRLAGTSVCFLPCVL